VDLASGFGCLGAGRASVYVSHAAFCPARRPARRPVDLAAALAETDRLLRGTTPLARWRAGAFDDIEDALLL